MAQQIELQSQFHCGPSLLRAPLPSLNVRNGYHTTSSALQSIYFSGKMAKWNIQSHIRQRVDAIESQKFPLMADPSLPSNALAFEDGIETCFGDYKICEESKDAQNDAYIPDFVATACPSVQPQLIRLNAQSKPRMKVVGEAKTPWRHNLSKYYLNWLKGKHETLRHAFGQIADYMCQFNMKYAFLTIYNFTIFLMQNPGNDGESILYFSEQIPHNNLPRSRENSVSVREFLYCMLAITKEPGSYIEKTTCASGDCASSGKPSQVLFHRDPVTPHSQPLHDTRYTPKLTPVPSHTISKFAPLQVYPQVYGEGCTAAIHLGREQLRRDKAGNLCVKINGRYIELEIIQSSDNSDNLDPSLDPSFSLQALSARSSDEEEVSEKPSTGLFGLGQRQPQNRSGRQVEVLWGSNDETISSQSTSQNLSRARLSRTPSPDLCSISPPSQLRLPQDLSQDTSRRRLQAFGHRHAPPTPSPLGTVDEPSFVLRRAYFRRQMRQKDTDPVLVLLMILATDTAPHLGQQQRPGQIKILSFLHSQQRTSQPRGPANCHTVQLGTRRGLIGSGVIIICDA
ncbi:hypothetical protein AJ79_05581 [Helicocarpus griseus UAMH5409]|uniref:Uncharacterized protein n=1 Tax=Helicocarpus griseus UAMH5409 TaxID=1447875 RepID=A0A2B7XLN0_9EURO|nr:hypothetical protein AJ79_05581 [Helicocarpus griseus UAMH5409]